MHLNKTIIIFATSPKDYQASLWFCVQFISSMIKMTLQIRGSNPTQGKSLEQPFAADYFMVQLFHYATILYFCLCIWLETLQQHH